MKKRSHEVNEKVAAAFLISLEIYYITFEEIIQVSFHC